MKKIAAVLLSLFLLSSLLSCNDTKNIDAGELNEAAEVSCGKGCGAISVELPDNWCSAISEASENVGYITETEAIEIAKEKISVEYDEIVTSFNTEHNFWIVSFNHKEMAGGYRIVYLSINGEILDVMWMA